MLYKTVDRSIVNIETKSGDMMNAKEAKLAISCDIFLCFTMLKYLL